MKRLHRYLPLLALLLLMLAGSITSCRDAGVRDALQRAEALMESDPHAARAVLDSLNLQSSIFNLQSKDAALYALLRTQADYKCRVRLTSDSLPLIATNYYGTRRKTQRAALAQYYLGCTYKDMHRDPDAIDALLRATTLFPDTSNKYFAYSLFELGKEYLKNHMNDNAIAAFNRYRFSDICNSDSLNISYADYYLGESAMYIGDDLLADSLYKCVIQNTKTPESVRCDSYYELAKLYYYHWHDSKKAASFLDKYLDFFDNEKGRGASLLLKAEILFEQKDLYSALNFYKKALENSNDLYTKCMANKGLANVMSLLNKSDSTQYCINQYTLLLDSIYSINRQEEIAEIQDKHIVEIHDQQLKARHTRFMLWMGIVLVAVVAGAVVFLLQADRRRKKHNLQLQEELRQANVALLQAQNDEQPADMDALYRNKLAACQNLFRSTPSARLLLTAPEKLTSEQRQALMDDLTRSFVDIMVDIRNASNGINNQEMMYCILASLQCSTTQMAVLLNTTDGTLRKRKLRLKEKMPENLFSLFFS